MSDAPTDGYDKFLADERADIAHELPQDRIAEFVEGWWPEHDENIEDTGLAIDDLRDVLNELEEHQRLLIQIDEALDENDPIGSIYEIRALLGNHTGGQPI